MAQARNGTVRGQQDDLVFATPRTGWYGNGLGKVFRTEDAGTSWSLVWNHTGTFVRALGFVDERVGVLGNVGVGAYPNVTDATPLYHTTDGGAHWSPARVNGPMPAGICAIDVNRFGSRPVIWAGGRVGGPAMLLRSDDGGATFTSRDMRPLTAMILDVKFVDARTGFIAGASDADPSASHAVVLRTTDGGATWQRVYESTRLGEITWKLAFPTATTGYVTVQNYDQKAAAGMRVVGKTIDGGATWRELPLIAKNGELEFGIGFLDERHGFVGGIAGGYETLDGGDSWQAVAMGRAVNKIRIVGTGNARRVYAIGVDLFMREAPAR